MIKPEWEKGGTMTTLDLLSGDTWTDITTTATTVATAEMFNKKKLSDAIFMSAEIMVTSSNSSYTDLFSAMFDSLILRGAVYKADTSGTTYRMSGEINVSNKTNSSLYTISGKVSLDLSLVGNTLQVSIKEASGMALPAGGATSYPFVADNIKIRNIRLIFN